MGVVIGVDAHKKTHTLVALDGNGRKLAEKTVEATDAGHAKALYWPTDNAKICCGSPLGVGPSPVSSSTTT